MSDLIQLSFDYSVLSPEQAQRTQEAEYRIIGRTQKTIVENGRDLLAVKRDIGHGHFVNWLQSIGLSKQTAERWMNVAENFGEKTHHESFENSALYLLSTSKVPESAREEAKERAEAGEKITEEIARQIRDAHKAKEQAEQQAQLAQQELFQSRAESHNAIIRLSQQIEDLQKQRDERQHQISTLQQQIASIKKPEVQIREIEKEVIPPDAQAKIAQAEAMQVQIAKLTEQRDNLSNLAQDLGKDLDTLREANEAKRQREIQEARVLQNWREATGVFHKQVLKLFTQFPTPVDTQIFEAEDWERLAQAENIARRFLGECEILGNRSTSMVIDAR